MDIITGLGVSGIAINAFVLTLLLSKTRKKLTDWLLSGWLVSLALNQVYFLWSDAHVQGTPFLLSVVGMGTVLVHTPLLYLFVAYAFRQRIQAIEVRHLFPFLLFVSVFGITFRVNPGAMRVKDGFIVFLEPPPFFLDFYGVYFALTAGTYTLAALYRTRRRKEEMDQFYSNQAREVIAWIQKLIVAAVLFFITTWMFIQFSLWQEQAQTAIVFPVVSSFITVYIVYIAFMGVRYSGVFYETIPEIHERLSKSQSENPGNRAELVKHAKKIVEAMEDREPYLNPDLTLPDLAGLCGLTTVKTSQALNQVIGKSFYSFVNEYRTRHFIRNMNKSEFGHLSLIGLAYECGFKSKSTFNRFFKDYTGHTPSRFRRERKTSPSV